MKTHNLCIYIASRYGRKQEAAALAEQIRALGIEVSSRWLSPDELPTNDVVELRRRAEQDFADVRRASILVRMSDPMDTEFSPTSWLSASRMEESGYAEALGIQVIVLGGHQSVFDHLSSRVHLADKEALLSYLAEIQKCTAYKMAEADLGTVPDQVVFNLGEFSEQL